MSRHRAALFRGRHFRDEIIVLCVRWYLRCSLSYRDLEEMMTERGLSVDHSTIARWVLRYAPILSERLRRLSAGQLVRGASMRPIFASTAAGPIYIERSIPQATIDFLLSPKRDAVAAMLFLQLALRSGAQIRPCVINIDGQRAYAHAITELKRSGELGRRCRCRRCPFLLRAASGGAILADHSFAPSFPLSGLSQNGPRRQGFASPRPTTARP